jgi:hypothetical protein
VSAQKKRMKCNGRSAAARRLLEMAGNPAKVEDAIRIVADRFLEGVSCPPTDLDSIRQRLNIFAIDSEDLPFSGELRKENGGLRIVCSKYLSPTRRRFTIAHEIGHAILETTGPHCPRVGFELEKICNQLASELLMPKHLFVESVNSELSIEKIFSLARAFGTSISATSIRCAELFGISAFGTEGKVVSWSSGMVKKGSTFRTDDELRAAVERAFNGQSGQVFVYLRSRIWTGEWKMEWAPIGRNGRALFLLQPYQSAAKTAVVGR